MGGARIADIGPGKVGEFAVTLRDEVQGRGLARQALESVVEVAREIACVSVWSTISAHNTAMLGLARRFDFTIRRDPDDPSLLVAEKLLEPD
ncbi:MAG: GNAT family N-acetyltransferase [Hyphomicrobiaceae bacterium]